jgi:hypothetical protein
MGSPQGCSRKRRAVPGVLRSAPGALAATLAAALQVACATALPGPALEVTADCQVRPLSSGGGGASFRGGSTAYGGGAPELGPLASTVEAPPPTDSDGPTPSSDGKRRSSDGGGAGAAIAGAVAAAVGVAAFAHYTDPAQMLRREGPMLPAKFSMSCLPVRGFVRGGWPLVVDYLSDGAGQPSLEIHLGTGGPAYVQALEGGRGRHLQHLALPPELGEEPRPALVLVKARGTGGPGRMQLLGLGAGPRAVGSVAIDQVDFGPPVLRRSARQSASYGFHSRSDFNHLAVAMLRIASTGSEIRVSLAREYRFDGGVSRDSRFGPHAWDGSDARNQTSPGAHLVQVRAWEAAGEAADWVTAWSIRSVQVSD